MIEAMLVKVGVNYFLSSSASRVELQPIIYPLLVTRHGY